MKKRNKRGQVGNAIVWIYKLIMLIIVISGIVMVVFLYYSKQYDVRNLESSVLTSKVIDCFSDKGNIKTEDFTKQKLYSCFNFNEDEIFLNVTLFKNEEQQSISLGEEDFKVYCEMQQENVRVKNSPSCLEEDFELLVDDVPGKINFFIAIAKFSKNI